MKKVRLSAVSYLNTKPFLYGIFKHKISLDLDIQLDIPSVCAEKLQRGEADIALVPVAIIPYLSHPKIVTDYCIATRGKVRTVCLFGESPIETWDNLYLDFHSRSSVQMTKMLLEKHWRTQPNLLQSQEGYIDKIKGTTGGLVIGDRTFSLHERFPYVFAAWVTNGDLPKDFLSEFNEALSIGLDSIPQLVSLMPDEYAHFNLSNYFTENIQYQWDASKEESMTFFLRKLDYRNDDLFSGQKMVIL
jgi:chorismate dehydratase